MTTEMPAKLMKLVVLLASIIGCSRAAEPALPPMPRSFDGDSAKLQRTVIVATLDEKIAPDKSAIWCAAFQASWKAQQADMAEKKILLEGSPALADALNAAADPRPHVPADSLYIAHGWTQDGIVERIGRELAAQFPGASPPPALNDVAEGSFVAFAHLQASLKFQLAFTEGKEPLTFTDGTGQVTPVTWFGVTPPVPYQLLQQPRVLFLQRNEETRSLESFAIDLDRASNPLQVVVARIDRRATLGETFDEVQKRIAANPPDEWAQDVGPNDRLAVPNFVFRIQHRFRELEHRSYLNASLPGQRVDVAWQDLDFRLDRNGVELKAQGGRRMQSMSTYYELDRPFLLYVMKRGASVPLLVMWVDNAELMRAWAEPTPAAN